MDPEARLTTARLEIEPLLPEHADELFPVLDDERLHEYTGGYPATLDELIARYEVLGTRKSPDGSEGWLNWIVREKESNAAVGTLQATIAGDRAFVAWVIARKWQGRGFAGEAAAALVSRLSDDPSITSIAAHIAPGHIASERVAERAGLTSTDEVVDGERVWRLISGGRA